mgnify:CR=1 FL=1
MLISQIPTAWNNPRLTAIATYSYLSYSSRKYLQQMWDWIKYYLVKFYYLLLYPLGSVKYLPNKKAVIAVFDEEDFCVYDIVIPSDVSQDTYQYIHHDFEHRMSTGIHDPRLAMTYLCNRFLSESNIRTDYSSDDSGSDLQTIELDDD